MSHHISHRKPVPHLGITAHFSDRHGMKKGHPSRRYRTPSLPAPKLPIDWTKNNVLTFPVDGNDQYGDCMYAGALHGDNTFTGNVGAESTFDLSIVLADYLKLSGGDNGLDEGTLIPAWKLGLASDSKVSILDALDIDPTNAAMAQSAIWLFGGILFMLDLPDAWISEFNTGVTWNAPASADANNGHGIWWNGVGLDGAYKLQTWGTYGWITPAGVAVCDPSAFVVFSLRWFNSAGYAPNGMHYVDLASLWTQAGGLALPPSPFPSPTPVPLPPPVIPPPDPTPTPIPVPKPPIPPVVSTADVSIYVKPEEVVAPGWTMTTGGRSHRMLSVDPIQKTIIAPGGWTQTA